MALEIFRLVGSVFVDTDKAEQSLKKTDKQAESLGNTLLKGAETVVKWGTGIATAAGAGAAALYGVATNAATAMDAIDKGSAKIGVSKRTYQEWSYVLGQNGMDISNLETGMKSLVSAMDGAASGTESAQEKFDALGLSIFDSNGALKDQETMLQETLYALANMENGTEKARLATELFGKAGGEMMPMLNNGAESMAELTARAHELGLVVSDDAVTAGVVLGDTIADVTQSFTTVINKICVEFMPVIQSVLDWVLAHMPEIQNACSVAFSIIGNLVVWVGSIFQSVFQAINDITTNSGITFESVMGTVQSLFTETMTVLQSIWNTIGQPVWDLISLAIDLVAGYFEEKMPEIQGFVRAAFSDIQQLWQNNLQPALEAIGDFIQNVLAPAFEFVFKTVVEPVVDEAFRAIAALWTDTLKPVLEGILDFITGVFTLDFEKAFSGLVNVIDGIWAGIETILESPINAAVDVIESTINALSNIFRDPINEIIGGINGFIDGVNQIKIPDWVPGIGGMGLSIGKLPYLEKGAVLKKGQVGILEGNGAEAVVPLEKNKQWISAVARDMDSALGQRNDPRIEAVLLDILALLERLAEMGIYLDTGALVGGLAKPIDKRLGQIQAAKARR